jgi:DNA-binding FrmR family transcriptional regulator
VHIASSQLSTVLVQLREAQGQLGEVNRMIETGGDCVDTSSLQKLFLSLA